VLVQSRRDQLQAYKFLTRRALAALVTGEPDVPEAPMRRLSVTTVTGIMVAILVAAGFAVVGLIRPGSNTKLEAGTVYIERDTGAQFVVLDDSNGPHLHPTLNYTSAVLAAGRQGKVATKTVSSGALSHLPHGATVGISGVPQSLPRGTDGLVRSPWTVCSQVHEQGASNSQAKVTLNVGGSAGTTLLAPDAGVVVSAPASRQRYLLWNGERLQVASDDIGTALGLQTANPLIVGTGLLNALPPGPALATPQLPGAGQPGPTVGNTRTLVGELIQVTDNQTFHLVLSNGLAQVSTVEADLLRTMPVGGQLRSPVPASLASVLRLQQPALPDSLSRVFDGLPPRVPTISNAPAQAGGACVVFHENSPLTLAVPPGTAPAGNVQVSESAQSRQGVADEVDVPAEKAAVVAQTNGAAARFVIAAPGRRFAASADALASLGYGAVTPVLIPSQLLLLVPSGPALDVDAARRPAS
jgi:type VII secretion protein EccB